MNNIQNNPYDILPTPANVNSYNRYPFKDFDEAIHHAKKKNLVPGEIAVCYYFDPHSVVGISAVLALGNLRKGGNLIFENVAPRLECFEHDVYKNINKQEALLQDNINVVNYNNKICSEVKQQIKDLETKITQQAFPSSNWVNLDLYDLDIK